MSRFITYRPEIDGLRTVAVLPVIFYHANFHLFGQNLVKGGFLGVDIFFVISGYLITSILLTGFETKNLTLVNFYERRARRILPILLFVITTSIPLSWFLFLPSEFQQYSWQILSSIFSVSNFYFWRKTHTGSRIHTKPFLHMVFGVEEQFYLFMPLLLLFIINQKQRRIRNVFLTLAFVSLIASHYMSIKDTQSSFYLLPFRAWELLIGAGIATLRDRKLSNLKFPCFPTVGLVIIVVCFFVFDENTLHHHLYTYPNTWSWVDNSLCKPKGPNNQTHTKQGNDFNWSYFLWIVPLALSSFLIYLMRKSFQILKQKLGQLFVFLLSILTYFLIEKPFRSFSLIKSRSFGQFFLWIWFCRLLLVGTQGWF